MCTVRASINPDFTPRIYTHKYWDITSCALRPVAYTYMYNTPIYPFNVGRSSHPKGLRQLTLFPSSSLYIYIYVKSHQIPSSKFIN